MPSSSLTSFKIPAGSFKYEEPKEPSLLMRTALRPPTSSITGGFEPHAEASLPFYELSLPILEGSSKQYHRAISLISAILFLLYIF